MRTADRPFRTYANCRLQRPRCIDDAGAEVPSIPILLAAACAVGQQAADVGRAQLTGAPVLSHHDVGDGRAAATERCRTTSPARAAQYALEIPTQRRRHQWRRRNCLLSGRALRVRQSCADHHPVVCCPSSPPRLPAQAVGQSRASRYRRIQSHLDGIRRTVRWRAYDDLVRPAERGPIQSQPAVNGTISASGSRRGASSSISTCSAPKEKTPATKAAGQRPIDPTVNATHEIETSIAGMAWPTKSRLSSGARARERRDEGDGLAYRDLRSVQTNSNRQAIVGHASSAALTVG